MKLEDPQLIETLAAEYVVGTLRGAARRGFDRYRVRWHVERRVQAWEDRLMPLAYALTPIAPSADVWVAIERRLGLSRKRPFRALPAALVLAAVLGGGFFLWRTTFPPSLEPLATIAAADARPIWQIEVDVEITRLRALIVGAAPAHVDRSFELWALPEGAAPVSLGLLPVSGRIERDLSVDQTAALRAAPRVAVSLEPADGSPTGAPTGPVLFVADRRLPG